MIISHTFFKRIFIFAQALMIGLIAIPAFYAQTGSVDLSFNAILSKESDANGFTLQPDGKIIVFGGFQIVNGVIKNQIARLNPDGSVDNSFDCTACDFGINSAIVQPDGKIIIAGSASSASTGTSAARLKRLNADGSLDASFNPTSPFNNPIIFQQSTGATVSAIQPDGKILVSVSISGGGFVSYALYRLNPNGTFDNTFTTINFQGGRTIFEIIGKVFVLPDGKILVSGNGGTTSQFAFLRRYNADGTRDTTFEAPVFTGNGAPFGMSYNIYDFDVQADGSIVIVGSFNTVNGVSRMNIVRLLPAGNVDLSFPQANIFNTQEFPGRVKILPDGKILISNFISNSPFPASGNPRFLRLNADGSVDNSFNAPGNLVTFGKFVIDAAGKIFLRAGITENGVTVTKFVRLNQDGSLDAVLNVTFGIGGSATALATQPDGKVIVFGDFTQASGSPRKNFARLNADGTLDTSFNPGTGFDSKVEKILVQTDGKILVGGSFTTYNGASRNGLARLNADGSLDAGFNPNIEINGTVYSVDLQTDGKILISGFFGSVNGQTRNGLARLNPDGSLDASFNPVFGGNATIRRVLVQADGKIIIGGTFNGVNGFARTNLVRLNSDGTLDATFNAGNISSVSQIEVQADGKYIVLASALVRLNTDGTSDAAFQSPTFQFPNNNNNPAVSAILIQSDGSIIIGGSFTAVNGIARSSLARLRSDGSVDTLFFPNGANNPIFAIVRQADGKIIIGGSFTRIADVTRLGIARLNIIPLRAPVTPYDYDGDGRADLAVFRPSNGSWYILGSQNNSFTAVQFGLPGDKIAPADYDGDGRTDIAVFRENVGGNGKAFFYILNSSDNSFRPAQLGQTGDVPVSGDWDGDGIGDLAVYRDGSNTNGQSYFFYRPSSQPGVDFVTIIWGATGDKPVVGDYDGDNKLDAAIFRPSIARWYILRSSNNQVISVQFGNPTDVPAPADFTDDGITDFAVFRPSNGNWYISSSQTNPSTNFTTVQFGTATDLPVPADYDGDGKADVAVFRPSNGVWYLLKSTQGFSGVQFGANQDKPAPNAYIR